MTYFHHSSLTDAMPLKGQPLRKIILSSVFGPIFGQFTKLEHAINYTISLDISGIFPMNVTPSKLTPIKPPHRCT